MDSLLLLNWAAAAAAGAVLGAAACYWPLSRVIARLRSRLDRSEQALSGAVERSVQAREQIAQLNRAITELRRSHSHASSREARREQVEQVLAEGAQRSEASPTSALAHGFADTLPLSMT